MPAIPVKSAVATDPMTRSFSPSGSSSTSSLAPEVHGAALVAAQASGKSLNQWATEILQEATQT